MRPIRHFGKTREVIPVPSLVNLQSRSYDEFLDSDTQPDQRPQHKGLEAIFREFFPITGYEDQVKVSYHGYLFSPPQHTLDECRDLGLTFQRGIKIKIRVEGQNHPTFKDVLEEDVHIGYFPIRIGGGEFIVNGAERTIVTQIQRSPGVDFSSETGASGRRTYSCRIIPERGSWIQVEQTSKDILQIKIDKSAKVVATCFLRALSKDHGRKSLEEVLAPAIKKHGGIDPDALRKAALEVDVPEGGTMLGFGAKFAGEGSPVAGQNMRAAPVVVQYVDDKAYVVWPKSQAQKDAVLPFPAGTVYSAK